MNKSFIIIIVMLLTFSVNAQNTVKEYVNEGIYYHDQGQYDKAIELYKKALEIDPNSALALYEIAFSHFLKKEYETAIIYSNQVIELNGEHLLSAYLVQGSCLDMIGKTKESIKLFKKGIKNFNHYLLNYNLALNYYKIDDLKNAKKYVINGIKLNYNHPSSHLLLGHIENATNNRIESLLSMHYFLILEPNTARSQEAFNILTENFNQNVSINPDKENTINITIPSNGNSDINSNDLMLSLLAAKTQSSVISNDKTEEELFLENTSSLFSILNGEDLANDIAIEFYTPIFSDLSNSEHIETYCYYISQIRNNLSVEWINNNQDKVSELFNWIENFLNK